MEGMSPEEQTQQRELFKRDEYAKQAVRRKAKAAYDAAKAAAHTDPKRPPTGFDPTVDRVEIVRTGDYWDED